MTVSDPENTRSAFAKFATGVCIVTASDNGNPIGMTVSSFNSVSLDPPLVLWSVGKHAPEYDAFCKMQHYAIHILGKNQVGLSNRFATPGSDKFEGLHYQYSEQGVPLIAGALACFHCQSQHNYPAGDHNILVGAVSSVDQCSAEDKASPLLYFASTYRQIGGAVSA